MSALFPAEIARITRAVPKRRAEFSTGRVLARELLHRRGLPPAEIGCGPHGNPLWPAGVCGSISHSGKTCVAVVGATGDYLGIGIDIEFDCIANGEARALILTPSELIHYDDPGLCRIVFSAKESFFKAVYPQHGDRIDFHDAEIHLNFDKSTFVINSGAVDPSLLEGLQGVFCATKTAVATLCLIPAPGRKHRPAD